MNINKSRFNIKNDDGNVMSRKPGIFNSQKCITYERYQFINVQMKIEISSTT